MPITRLQLGTSRLENLNPQVQNIFADKRWIHLGDRRLDKVRIRSPFYYMKLVRDCSLYGALKMWTQKLFQLRGKTQLEKDLFTSTTFMSFWYKKGDTLPFRSQCFDFIYSEHFFEHLFLDEAISLLCECVRVLKPNGVIRTVVPDADLRIYMLPEPVGFPDRKMEFTNPDKHKTRWSVYSLSEVNKLVGLVPIPLVFCDKFREYYCFQPIDLKQQYLGCPDFEIVSDLCYITRLKNSLIVDGIKKTM